MEEGEIEEPKEEVRKDSKPASSFPLIVSNLPVGLRLTQVQKEFERFGEVRNVSFLVPNIYGISEGFFSFFFLI